MSGSTSRQSSCRSRTSSGTRLHSTGLSQKRRRSADCTERSGTGSDSKSSSESGMGCSTGRWHRQPMIRRTLREELHQSTSNHRSWIHLSEYFHQWIPPQSIDIRQCRCHRAALLHLWLGSHPSRILQLPQRRSELHQSRLPQAKCHQILTCRRMDHRMFGRRSQGSQERTSDASANRTTKGKDVDNG